MAQRLGRDVEQKEVFSGKLLKDLVRRLAARWSAAAPRSHERMKYALVNAAFHLYAQAGLRANEGFYCIIKKVSDSFVVGSDATDKEVRPHLEVGCSTQTKEQRYKTTKVVVAAETYGDCPLATGKWMAQALKELTWAGRGPIHEDYKNKFIFTTLPYPEGVQWTMGYFWTFVLDELKAAKTERTGGLGSRDDLTKYGGNSFRRTWNTMAAKEPNAVPKALRDRHGRWRGQQADRQPVQNEMTELYDAADVDMRTRPTYFLTPLSAL
jgi:hypothetical protein